MDTLKCVEISDFLTFLSCQCLLPWDTNVTHANVQSVLLMIFFLSLSDLPTPDTLETGFCDFLGNVK